MVDSAGHVLSISKLEEAFKRAYEYQLGCEVAVTIKEDEKRNT